MMSLVWIDMEKLLEGSLDQVYSSQVFVIPANRSYIGIDIRNYRTCTPFSSHKWPWDMNTIITREGFISKLFCLTWILWKGPLS